MLTSAGQDRMALELREATFRQSRLSGLGSGLNQSDDSVVPYENET